MPLTDLAVIAAYFAATALLGWRLSRSSAQGPADGYFLGARNLPAGAVMLSIVATETSALTVISVPGIAARGDLAFLQLAFGYVLGRIGVAWLLLPGYFNGHQQTAYDRLQTRFGVATRQCVSLAFLVTRFMADGVRIFAGAIPLALLTGWDAGWAIVLMGGVTLAYTLAGGLRAVVWTDVLQWAVYMAGGTAALVFALQLAATADGSLWAVLERAQAAGKLQVLHWEDPFSRPFTLLGGLVGGALMSAASHGTDHLIVQRLLATRSLRSARWALVGSGLLVTAQFALFLLLGTALWAAGAAPQGLSGDELLPRFVLQQLPSGLAGLLMAGILAAAMSTISSSISAMASSLTHDLYAPWAGLHPVRDAARLQRAGRWFSLLWGLLLIAAALGLHAAAPARDTPVVVLTLSVASITYGALLGVYLLSSPRSGVQGPQVIAGALTTVLLMTGLVLARPLSAWPPLGWLAPAAQLAFPWYVPLGTAITVAVAVLAAHATRAARITGRRRWYAAASPSRTRDKP